MDCRFSYKNSGAKKYFEIRKKGADSEIYGEYKSLSPSDTSRVIMNPCCL